VQAVQVAAVRHATPGRGPVGQLVALDDRDLCVVVGEHPGGQQPGDARAQDDGMVVHGVPPR
jgi:hypothetical protein